MPHATLRARLGVTAASLIAGVGLSLVPALTSTAAASAPHPGTDTRSVRFDAAAITAKHHHASHEARLVHHHDPLVHKVITEARKQKGKPYSYGAAGPSAFD